MMLRHLHMHQHADKIEKAVYAVLAEGKVRTKDIGGTATTTQMTTAIIEKIFEAEND